MKSLGDGSGGDGEEEAVSDSEDSSSVLTLCAGLRLLGSHRDPRL